MDQPVRNALWLLRRQMELETRPSKRGATRLAEEQELLAIEGRLTRYPEAIKAIFATAHELHRPVDVLSEADVLRSARNQHVYIASTMPIR